MAGLAPVGVKHTRASRAARSAAPARAHLGSAFTAGGRADFRGQSLSLGVAASTSRKGGSRCVTSMAAKVAGYIKLAIEAGKANPAPPIGPALGAKVRSPTEPRPTGTRRAFRDLRGEEWRPRPEARSDRASPCRRAVRTTARALPRVPAHVPARSRRTSTVEAPARASAQARVIAPEP
jgi:hypothetical protein